MCKYMPRFFAGYKFLATCKKSERQRDRKITGQILIQRSHFQNNRVAARSAKHL